MKKVILSIVLLLIGVVLSFLIFLNGLKKQKPEEFKPTMEHIKDVLKSSNARLTTIEFRIDVPKEEIFQNTWTPEYPKLIDSIIGEQVQLKNSDIPFYPSEENITLSCCRLAWTTLSEDFSPDKPFPYWNYKWIVRTNTGLYYLEWKFETTLAVKYLSR